MGCGTGTLTRKGIESCPKAAVTGIDADPRMLIWARAKASRNLTVMKFDHGFAEKLPDADGSFARVVSALFFHHLRPELKASALRDAYRFLVLGVKSTSLIGRPMGQFMRLLFLIIRFSTVCRIRPTTPPVGCHRWFPPLSFSEF